MNSCTFVGNLVKDPTLRTASWTKADGTAATMKVANFRIGVNDPTAKKAEEKTVFIDVAVWGKGADIIGQYMTKGRSITVVGPIGMRVTTKDNKIYHNLAMTRIWAFEFNGKRVMNERPEDVPDDVAEEVEYPVDECPFDI